MLAPELKHQVRKLWDKFWAGGIANPLPAIEQITYLIFMKRLEVLDKQRQEEGKPSIFDGPNDLRRWSKFKYLSAEDTGPKGLLPHVRDTVFPFIQGLDVLGDAFVHEMRDAVFMIPKPSLLSGAIVILDGLFDQQRHVLAGRNADILGDIYEHLLSEIRTAGKNGQFRTPRHIIRAIIELIDPKPGERICDPAFGTGGFLVNSYQHMLKMHTARDSLVFDADGTPHNLDGDLLGDRKRFLTGCKFVGYDFDRTMVRLGLMNMVLHGLDDPHGRYADTLSQRFAEAGQYDVVMTNPPFTGSIDKADKSDRFALDTNKTELLFIELLLNLLVPGGRAGVIVPEGVLFGSTRAHRELRRRLVWDNQLDAVISLPTGVFQPYTGVKTSILIFTKGEDQDEQRAEPLTKQVWLYEIENDGYSLDARRLEQPEQNDLWDLPVKFKLVKQQPASIWIDDDRWIELRALPPNELRMDYFQPIFCLDRWQDGGSIFPHTDEAARQFYEDLKAAKAAVVRTFEDTMARAARQARAKAIGVALANDVKDALAEAKKAAEKVLEKAIKEVNTAFERAARAKQPDEFGLDKPALGEYGYEEMSCALGEGQARAAEAARVALNEAGQAAKAALADGMPPAAEAGTTPPRDLETTAKKLVTVFARLDGYDAKTLGKVFRLPGCLEEAKDWQADTNEVQSKDWNLYVQRYKPLILASVGHDPLSRITRELQLLERQIQEGLDALLSMVEGID